MMDNSIQIPLDLQGCFIQEKKVVRDLIELLNLTGVVFTFDALHCQKKRYQRSPHQAMTI